MIRVSRITGGVFAGTGFLSAHRAAMEKGNARAALILIFSHDTFTTMRVAWFLPAPRWEVEMSNLVAGLLCMLFVFCLRLLWDICKLERRVKDLEDKP